MRALLSHRLNVFVVLPQSEDILKDTLKPSCFASALFSRFLPACNKTPPIPQLQEQPSDLSLLASPHEI